MKNNRCLVIYFRSQYWWLRCTLADFFVFNHFLRPASKSLFQSCGGLPVVGGVLVLLLLLIPLKGHGEIDMNLIAQKILAVRDIFPYDSQQPYLKHDEWEVGYEGFEPISFIGMAQVRISHLNIERRLKKVDEALSTKNGESPKKFDQGRALFDLENPLEVILSPFGLIVEDKHHFLLAQLIREAQTVPVRIVEDLRNIPSSEFWQTMASQGRALLTLVNGDQLERPTRPEDLQNDPNRYLASLMRVKLVFKKTKGFYEVKQETESENSDPLWIDSKDSRPGIEFHIGDALRRAGIVYQPEWGDTIPSEVNEQAREVLRTEQESNPQFEGLILIPVKYAGRWRRHAAFEFLDRKRQVTIFHRQVEALESRLSPCLRESSSKKQLIVKVQSSAILRCFELAIASKKTLKSLTKKSRKKTQKLGQAKKSKGKTIKLERLELEIIKTFKWYISLTDNSNHDTEPLKLEVGEIKFLQRLLAINQAGIFSERTSFELSHMLAGRFEILGSGKFSSSPCLSALLSGLYRPGIGSKK